MRQFLLVSALLVAHVVQADEASNFMSSTPEQRAGFQSQYMTEHLALPADVAAKVQAINLKYARQMDPIIKGAGGRLEKMQKSRGVLAAKDKELQAVLTPDQYQKYDDIKDDMKTALESSFNK